MYVYWFHNSPYIYKDLCKALLKVKIKNGATIKKAYLGYQKLKIDYNALDKIL